MSKIENDLQQCEIFLRSVLAFSDKETSNDMWDKSRRHEWHNYDWDAETGRILNMKWHWKMTCELCKYTTRIYRWRWIPRLLAIWHALRWHPFGRSLISAVKPYCECNNSISEDLGTEDMLCLNCGRYIAFDKDKISD